jgi:hypothetical protein
MDVGRGVVGVERAGVGDTLGAQHRARQLLAERAIGVGGKQVGGRVDIHHRHGGSFARL